jgi:plasmid stabilization system protein ParE
MIVRYKKRTLGDIEQIHRYIAGFDPAAARRVVQRIENAIGRLNILPLSGRPGVVSGTRLLQCREFPASSFIVSGTMPLISSRSCIPPEKEEAESPQW